MDKRYFASLAVRVVVAIAISALLPGEKALGKEDRARRATNQGKSKKTGQLEGRPPGWSEGNKEGWESELPPGWKNWDDAKRQQWKHGLDRAKNAVRKHAEARLNAALRALEMGARKGVPLQDAEKMAKTGLEHGLGPFDFNPLGKFVVERVKAGVKGEELSKAIHEQLKRRQQERERLRAKMKEKVKQRHEEHKRLRGGLKEKKQLGNPQQRKSLEEGGEEREKDVGKHRPSHPKGARGKGGRKEVGDSCLYWFESAKKLRWMRRRKS